MLTPLGRLATGKPLETDETIIDVRSRTFDREGPTVVTGFHPTAATLYDRIEADALESA